LVEPHRQARRSALHAVARARTLDGQIVETVPFRQGKDHGEYRGFTYILPCTSKK
jgi:hypothetical protein